MITRIVSNSFEYNLLNNPVSEKINTAGYKSAKVVVSVNSMASGEHHITFTDDKGETMTLFGEHYKAKEILINQYLGGLNSGTWELDLSNTDELNVSIPQNGYTNGKMYIYFSYDEMEYKDYPDAYLITYGDASLYSYEFDVKDNYALVSLTPVGTLASNRVFRFAAMAEGSDSYVNITPWDYDTGVRYSAEYFQTKNAFRFWVYTPGYTKFKVSVDMTYSDCVPFIVRVEQTATLKRTIKLGLSESIDSRTYLWGKAKFVGIDWRGATITQQHGALELKDSGNHPSVYSRSGRKLMLNEMYEIIFDSNKTTFRLASETAYGGVVFKYNVPVSVSAILNTYIPKLKPNGSVSYNGNLYLTFSDKEDYEFEKFEDNLVKRTNNYDVYEYDNLGGQVVDALGEDVLVKLSDTKYRFYRNGFDCWYYDFTIDSTHIPSLLSGEGVKFVKLVATNNNPVGCNMNRLCLFTNKNRILYNFVNDFLDYFREAPVYNLKKRFYPVNDKSLVSSVAKYLPIYPDYDYNQFSGRVGNGTTDKDDFGILLPARGSSIGTLLEDYHKDGAGLGKLVYSNFVNSKDYGCIYGNYNLANGDPIVLATANGKEWSIIESFASVEDYSRDQLTTLRVDLSTIISNAGGYTSGSLKMTHRKYNIPTDTDKNNPVHPFTIGESAVVASITINDNHETIVTFVDESSLIAVPADLTRLTDLAPVFFFENISASSEYDYICNSCDQDGNGNTGIFFRLQRIGTNQYKLWGDVGNPFEGNLICRHIHSVSEYQSGFIVATGENYRINYGSVDYPFFEGGFIFKINTTRVNSIYPQDYTHVNALTNFFNVGNPTYRLTSSPYGVNRACGAFLGSDIDNTLLFMSDYLYGTQNVVEIPGRSNGFSRTKFGIYKIGLSDIDDMSKSNCVAEVKEPGLGLVEHRGRFFGCLSCGEAIFSSDYGNTWHYETIGRLFGGGVTNELFYTDIKGLLGDGSVFYHNTRFVFK